MNFYNKKFLFKLGLLLIALIITSFSLIYTSRLIEDLGEQERNKVELWAEGMKHLVSTDAVEQDVSFIFQVIKDNETVPVIVADENGNVLSHRNLDSTRVNDPVYLKKEMIEMQRQNKPIELVISPEHIQYIYYKDSILITRLFYYPIIQLFLIITFIIIAYLLFSSFRKAEQNQVWIGMAKETAHQLGTPISSLMAWFELIKLNSKDEIMNSEISKDINRLEIIANRFSKIGSSPILIPTNINETIETAVEYIKTRTSKQIIFTLDNTIKDDLFIPLNVDLFAWVIENLCRNAVDAMSGIGKIDITIVDNIQFVTIDVKDTGKGISKSKFKTVFKPGYTTKKRGWGLGLSLTKRIIEDYHGGKIFVKSSEVNQGTTFRIIMKKFTKLPE